MKRMHIIFSTGILLISHIGYINAQPPIKGPDHREMRLPMVAPFGGPGMQNTMETSPPSPMTLDITELKIILEEVGVSKPVVENILTITRNFVAYLDGRLIRIHREELNVREELLKDKPDLNVVRDLTINKSKIFAEVEFSQIKRDLEIKSLLSKDEYEKWKSLMARKMRMMMPQMTGKNVTGPDKNHQLQPKQ